MKILIACEFSAIVRTEFEKKGHDAVSCDIRDSERSGKHYKGNVLDILNENWDMMIAHPPCTYLSFAGNKYFNIEKYGQKAIERHKEKEKAIEFFLKLWNAPINKICIENPKGYIMQKLPFSQVVNPYFFGDKATKKTLLWLKNLPPLQHSKEQNLFSARTWIEPPPPIYTGQNNKRYFNTESISGNSEESKKERSRFFPKIAEAMANQWG